MWGDADLWYLLADANGLNGMPRIPEDELARLKREVSLVRLVETSGVKLGKRGADLSASVPFTKTTRVPIRDRSASLVAAS